MLVAPRGAGKTTFCRALVEEARAAGCEVAGLLSPALFEGGVKTGIMAQDLRSGEARVLARAEGAVPLPPSFDLPLGGWLFDRAVLAWGDQLLAGDLRCDLLVVDELGPLELLHGTGWVNALEALRRPGYRWAVAVVRPELADLARRTLAVAENIPFQPAEDATCQARAWWKAVAALGARGRSVAQRDPSLRSG